MMANSMVALRHPRRLAIKERLLLDLGLAGEPDAVLPVREALEKPAIGLRDAVDLVGQLLHLPPLGAGEPDLAHAAPRPVAGNASTTAPRIEAARRSTRASPRA